MHRINSILRCQPQGMMVCFKSASAPAASVSISRKETEADKTKQELDIPFSTAKIGTFFQPKPVLHNQYREDVTLQSYLKRHLPADAFNDISSDLDQFGQRVATDIYELGVECDHNLPVLKHYDAWGNRVDEIVTCSAWKEMKKISAKEGLIAIAYERKHGQWSRLHQIAKNYLYAPSAGRGNILIKF